MNGDITSKNNEILIVLVGALLILDHSRTCGAYTPHLLF